VSEHSRETEARLQAPVSLDVALSIDPDDTSGAPWNSPGIRPAAAMPQSLTLKNPRRATLRKKWDSWA